MRAKPFTVHVDKVKPYLLETPKGWLKSAEDRITRTDVATQTNNVEVSVADEPPAPVPPAEVSGTLTDFPLTSGGNNTNEADLSASSGSQSLPQHEPSAAVREDGVLCGHRPQRNRRSPRHLKDFIWHRSVVPRIGPLTALSRKVRVV